MLKKVAITGNIGSGKTTVSRFLKELGATVVSADEIVHSLLTPQTEIGQKAIQLLGHEICINGQIDRKKIAEKVFTHPQQLDQLEKLIHPAVYSEIEKRYKEAKGTLFAAEIPLLFETGGEEFFDTTVAVIADPKLRMERFTESNGCNKEDFLVREKQQINAEQKAKLADRVLANNGTLNELKKNVEKLYNRLTT